jgi:hypothetical protein
VSFAGMTNMTKQVEPRQEDLTNATHASILKEEVDQVGMEIEGLPEGRLKDIRGYMFGGLHCLDDKPVMGFFNARFYMTLLLRIGWQRSMSQAGTPYCII